MTTRGLREGEFKTIGQYVNAVVAKFYATKSQTPDEKQAQQQLAQDPELQQIAQQIQSLAH